MESHVFIDLKLVELCAEITHNCVLIPVLWSADAMSNMNIRDENLAPQYQMQGTCRLALLIP
jgi:hypothetical protein